MQITFPNLISHLIQKKRIRQPLIHPINTVQDFSSVSILPFSPHPIQCTNPAKRFTNPTFNPMSRRVDPHLLPCSVWRRQPIGVHSRYGVDALYNCKRPSIFWAIAVSPLARAIESAFSAVLTAIPKSPTAP